MAILQGDIKFIAAKKMTETPDGGGPPSANVIGDAVSNAIFGDISEQMRAGGKVNVKSIFAAVQSMDTDQYLGAHVILSKPPQDPLISITLARAEVFDTRADILPRLEAYLNAGSEWPGVLFGNHIMGQRTLQIFARPGVDGPTVGRTLVLQYRYGQPDSVEQYVRVTRVTVETRVFTTLSSGTPVDYEGQVFTVDISDPLRADFSGSAASRTFARDAGTTLIRDTVVADAAEYYGASPLAEPVAVGDVSVKVASVYSQLVPNSRTETPVTDKRPASDSVITLATSPRRVEVAGSPFSQRIRIGQENRGYSFVTILKPLPAPGTVRAQFRALGRNYTLTDDGQGRLTGAGSGTVNYLTGSVAVTLDALPDDRSALMFYWGQRETYDNRAGMVTARAPEYLFDLDHQGLVSVSSITWPSAGVTRTASVSGSGVISGDATGRVMFQAGLVQIRPNYMPDPGGEFLVSYQWDTVVDEILTVSTPDPAGSVLLTFSQEPVPGSLEVQWLTSRVTSASSGATSAAGSSTKSSGATTSVAVVEETKTFRPFAGRSEFDAAYSAPIGQYELSRDSFYVYPGMGQPVGAPSWSLTTKTPVVSTTSFSESSSASYATAAHQESKTSVAVAHIVTDDGAGNFYGTMGSVAYASKQATLKVVSDYSESSFQSSHEKASEWESINATSEPVTTVAGNPTSTAQSGGGGSTTSKGGATGSGSFKEELGTAGIYVRYRTGLGAPQAGSTTYTPPVVTLDLLPLYRDVVVPGSVQFSWMGHTYVDFEGVIYRGRTDLDPGVPAGLMNYTSGLAVMTDYVVGANPGLITIQSLWTYRVKPSIANISFMLPVSPSKPGSLIFSVTDVGGNQLVATSDLSGRITGPHLRGTADFESGLVEIQCGDYVLDSSLTDVEKTEWWYSSDDVRVSDSKIWRPWPVDPSTLRYAAVGYSYLPLQADILGMDPVRLPPDGRVPIFRRGGYVVMGHTGEVGPVTVSNGQTISCGRVRLSRIRVIGDDGQPINNGYVVNLDAGTLTFSDVTGYSQPVTIQHRIEDMLVAGDVQINGALSFTRAITHDYPVGAFVSSAPIFGDLSATVTDVWDQQTWTGSWSDSPIGSPATGTYNDTLAPVAVTNADAIPERWAIVFTNSTAFYAMGEHVGVIATGSTAADLAPLNPATGRPYFTLPAIGWGGGWSAGNVLRFNTDSPLRKIAVIRTTQPGPEPAFIDHDFELLIRGDVDRP